MNIAILLIEMDKNSLTGGGGAERFFSDFYDIYHAQGTKKHNLLFITDRQSSDELNRTNRLNYKKNVLNIKIFHNRFKYQLQWIQVLFWVIFKRIDLIHIALYNRFANGYIKYFRGLPAFVRPKIVIQIVDPQVPHIYTDANHPRHKNYLGVYAELFNNLTFDGVYSWYMLFKEYFEKDNRIKCKPYIEAVRSRFTNGSRYVPLSPKKNEIIWAARLVENKQPLFFIETVYILSAEFPDSLNGWKIRMFGKGPQENQCMELIQKYRLEKVIALSAVSDMKDIVGYSKCFVSTQDYENFPSQSMNEAMAAGNAIVSRNVGQTNYFVKHQINGVLAEEDNPRGLAMALKFYLGHPEMHEQMQKESIRQTKEVHTPENFIRDIDIFWDRFK